MQPFVVPAIDVLERQLARGERADAAGDEDRATGILVLVGDDGEAGLAVVVGAAQPDHLFREVHRRLPAESLLRESFHQVLREDLRKARDVEDVFLGIQRGELAADLVEVVDQAMRGAAHPRIERGEQTGRAGADDDDIFGFLHRAYTSVVLALGLLAGACAGAGRTAALGWSLGGEAHVFFAGDRFARDYYRRLTGSSHLADSLARRQLVSVPPGRRRVVQVFSASGAAPATITLARFHARGRCGYDGMVTELVLAFPGGASASTNHIPPAHKPILGILDQHSASSGGTGSVQPALSRSAALELVNRVVRGAAAKATLLRPLTLDPDQAADAGEVVPLGSSYGVGFRARVLTTRGDTLLLTGVGLLVLIDEFADVSADDSREAAVDVASREVIAAQPLALRCP